MHIKLDHSSPLSSIPKNVTTPVLYLCVLGGVVHFLAMIFPTTFRYIVLICKCVLHNPVVLGTVQKTLLGVEAFDGGGP